MDINMFCGYAVTAWLVLALLMFVKLLWGVRDPKSPKRPPAEGMTNLNWRK